MAISTEDCTFANLSFHLCSTSFLALYVKLLINIGVMIFQSSRTLFVPTYLTTTPNSKPTSKSDSFLSLVVFCTMTIGTNNVALSNFILQLFYRFTQSPTYGKDLCLRITMMKVKSSSAFSITTSRTPKFPFYSLKEKCNLCVPSFT